MTTDTQSEDEKKEKARNYIFPALKSECWIDDENEENEYFICREVDVLRSRVVLWIVGKIPKNFLLSTTDSNDKYKVGEGEEHDPPNDRRWKKSLKKC